MRSPSIPFATSGDEKALKKFEDVMHNIREVLRVKEQQLESLQKEIEALRLSIRILEEEEATPPKISVQSIDSVSLKDNGARPTGTGIKHFP